MAYEESQLVDKPVGIRNIVGIHAGEVDTACAIDAFVQTGREPAPFSIAPADDAGIVKVACDGEALIVRTVVAEKELEIVIALIEERANGQLQSRGAIEEGHSDGDDRVRHRFSLFSSFVSSLPGNGEVQRLVG